MYTQYIRTASTIRDPEGINQEVEGELQVGSEDDGPDTLQVTVNNWTNGRELINVKLTGEQVEQLQAACALFLEERR